jgi:hypothetical protein
VELSDRAGLFPNSHGPAKVLSLEPRFGNAGTGGPPLETALRQSLRGEPESLAVTGQQFYGSSAEFVGSFANHRC